MSYIFSDQFSNLRLLEISPLSTRAASWLARAPLNNLFPEKKIVQIAGSIFMLRGLDYHHTNFMLQFDRIKPHYDKHKSYLNDAITGRKNSLAYPEMTAAENLIHYYLQHEAIAYINRMGQFYYFAKSEPIKLDSYLPRIAELMLFRKKHTAHRSIDQPQKETETEKIWQATSFGFHLICQNFFPVFQIFHNEKFIQLHMRDDHPIIMQEALTLLQEIHSVPEDALI
jgi:hypothetical protein